MPQFTSENGAKFQAKAVQARLVSKYVELDSPQSSVNSPQIAEEIARLRTRMNDVYQAMEHCTKASEWDALSRAYERFCKAWIWLAGIPGPGQFKPEQNGKSEMASMLGFTLPIEPVCQDVPHKSE